MIYCDISDVKIHGRLGNNLFKMAACLSLAKNNECEVIFSKSEYNIFKNINLSKDLSQFAIDFVYSEQFFHYCEILYKKNILLEGYFQSEKYFIKNKEYILECFELKEEIKNFIEKKYSKLINSNTCSLHIRRGDYLGLKDYYKHMEKEYYINAMEIVSSKTEIDNFIFFSDDIDWCKKNFHGKKFTFVHGEKDYEDLYLMSLCKNNIIANSSFSWWGAYLNRNRNKIIISPKTWFSEKLSYNDTKDLIPCDWIKI